MVSAGKQDETPVPYPPDYYQPWWAMVVIAGASALLAELARWGVDELRWKFGSQPPPREEDRFDREDD